MPPSRGSSSTESEFQPLIARTHTIRRPFGPVIYDSVKLSVIRDGSALAYSDSTERFVSVGDVVLLGPNTLCGLLPEGQVTVSTMLIDTDFLFDQLFWQHAAVLGDRLAAQALAKLLYTEPAQVFRLNQEYVRTLAPWLDELVILSIEERYREKFHRMAALWHSIMDQIEPFIPTAPAHMSLDRRVRTQASIPRHRKYTPLRVEAHAARELLKADLSRQWTLPLLATSVHLSEKQLVRVFHQAFGKTPLAYLTILRVEAMASLLRETNLSIMEVAKRVGWESRNRAAGAFKMYVGVTPGKYRQLQGLE